MAMNKVLKMKALKVIKEAGITKARGILHQGLSHKKLARFQVQEMVVLIMDGSELIKLNS